MGQGARGIFFLCCVRAWYGGRRVSCGQCTLKGGVPTNWDSRAAPLAPATSPSLPGEVACRAHAMPTPNLSTRAAMQLLVMSAAVEIRGSYRRGRDVMAGREGWITRGRPRLWLQEMVVLSGGGGCQVEQWRPSCQALTNALVR